TKDQETLLLWIDSNVVVDLQDLFYHDKGPPFDRVLDVEVGEFDLLVGVGLDTGVGNRADDYHLGFSKLLSQGPWGRGLTGQGSSRSYTNRHDDHQHHDQPASHEDLLRAKAPPQRVHFPSFSNRSCSSTVPISVGLSRWTCSTYLTAAASFGQHRAK